MTNLRPEHELLICIARKAPDEEVSNRIRSLVQHNIDWDHLFQTASVHGLSLLLATHLLNAARPLLPEPILQQAKANCLNGSKSNIYLLRELLRILSLFTAEDIPVLAFKGPVLSEMIYGDVGLRQPGDLDILVAKEDFHRTKALLQSNRYLMSPQLTIAQEKSHLGFHCEIQFCNQDQFSVVDLHWGLSPKTFPFSLPFAELWSRRQTVRLAGQSIATFSNEDLLLYLCVHGAKHYWSRLEWIAGVAELGNSTPSIEWSHVLQRAKNTRSMKILSLSLLLANRLFELRMPQDVIKSLEESDEIRQCVVGLEQKLFDGHEGYPTQVDAFRWNLRFMDRKRDAVAGFLRSIFVPTISDWQKVHVPDALYPLYYGMRPFLLLKKYGTRRND